MPDNDFSNRLSSRQGGYLRLEDYGAIGEGRSVALSGADGSLDWWCAPNMDSAPLFDRLLDLRDGGYFVIQPDRPFTVTRHYRHSSNVLETVFTTNRNEAVLTESMNSGTAGRLPWSELARRIEGRTGTVRLVFEMVLSRRGNTVSSYSSLIGNKSVFHIGNVLGLLLHRVGTGCTYSDEGTQGTFSVAAGEREVLALVAGQDEPLVVPMIEEIDNRIDISDAEWRTWARSSDYDGPDRNAFVRSALVLELLLYSPSGAIAAAATTSPPEKIGGRKNYDYRYAWPRVAGYLIELYKSLKNDLPAFNGDPSWTLPMPARYVVGQDGAILYAEVNPTVPAVRNRKTCCPHFVPQRPEPPPDRPLTEASGDKALLPAEAGRKANSSGGASVGRHCWHSRVLNGYALTNGHF
ncbi:trehalase-like domain-containing protein [Aliirhizobium smilacinae]|uniref:trehalase-like domain-containing protein n=1 Tax=Aliirhizobium smilacinae TaxID=1395944 RepID=UPI00374425D2